MMVSSKDIINKCFYKISIHILLLLLFEGSSLCLPIFIILWLVSICSLVIFSFKFWRINHTLWSLRVIIVRIDKIVLLLISQISSNRIDRTAPIMIRCKYISQIIGHISPVSEEEILLALVLGNLSVLLRDLARTLSQLSII